jgi:hypothetical protein
MEATRHTTNNSARKTFVICCDMEPDDRDILSGLAPEDVWRATGKFIDFIDRQRTMREQCIGSSVRINWFWRADPQVAHSCGDAAWAVQHFDSPIAKFAEAGDEHGNHPHAWRWSEMFGWHNDFADDEWVEDCVVASHEVLARSIPNPLENIRYGDRFMSAVSCRAIEKLGYRFDLTPEPGQPGRLAGEVEPNSTGMIPDYQSTPQRAYVPSSQDPAREDPSRSSQLRMVPVSTWTGWRISKKWPVLKRETIPLNAALPPRHFRRVLKFSQESTRPILVAVMRSGDFAPHRFEHFMRENLQMLFRETDCTMSTPRAAYLREGKA